MPPRIAIFPSLIAGISAFVVGVNLIVGGLIMQRITRTRVQAARLAYLSTSKQGIER